MENLNQGGDVYKKENVYLNLGGDVYKKEKIKLGRGRL